MPDQSAHSRRIHRALLTGPEQHLLQPLARATPDWVSPDMMTALGVAGALLAGCAYAACATHLWLLWVASLGVLLNYIGDALDGALARLRRQERPRYGFFIDRAADTLSLSFVFIGIGLSPFVRLDIALLASVAYLALMIVSLCIYATRGVFPVTYGPLGPSEARLALIFVTTCLYFAGAGGRTPLLGSLAIGDLCALGVATILFITAALATARELALLRVADDTARRSA
jgi:phosphatidylglycerophosphate synthase